MKKFLILAASAAVLTTFAPAASFAQIGIDTPVGGVRIGEPGYRHHYRDYDGPVVRERRTYRDRDVRLGGCKTVTIRHDDGSMKRIRRCD
jgi:hypothetical protein